MASSTAGAVVYFLLPLPEPIILPEGVPFPYEEAEDYGDFLNRVAREGAGQDALHRGLSSAATFQSFGAESKRSRETNSGSRP